MLRSRRDASTNAMSTWCHAAVRISGPNEKVAALKTILTVATLMMTLASLPAAAHVVDGNDTSGIIPWSRANEAVAREVAQAHCAHYGKYGRITGVDRRYGQYISFNCLWSPRIARYVLPEVHTIRSDCHRVWRRGHRHRVLVCR